MYVRMYPYIRVFNPKGSYCHAAVEQLETGEGMEAHLATNYLGPYLLTMRLLPHLQSSATVCILPPSFRCMTYWWL